MFRTISSAASPTPGQVPTRLCPTPFTLLPHDVGTWLNAVIRHWSLDRADPR